MGKYRRSNYYLGIRTVKIRTGIVLGKDEGFLKKITPSFKAGFGAILGSGKQYVPWIHVEDLCQIYLKAIVDTEMQGAYNATITDNTTNATLSKILAHLYGYTIWLPNIPAFLIRIGLGEMSIAVLEDKEFHLKKYKKQVSNFNLPILKQHFLPVLPDLF
jgi:NAD dependent epimerase/dehydratase family enzyme